MDMWSLGQKCCAWIVVSECEVKAQIWMILQLPMKSLGTEALKTKTPDLSVFRSPLCNKTILNKINGQMKSSLIFSHDEKIQK